MPSLEFDPLWLRDTCRLMKRLRLGTGRGKQWGKFNGSTDGCARIGVGIHWESICTQELGSRYR